MTLWDLCIKRPIFTVMLISAPIVLGIVGRSRLGVDLLPNVELPIVVVTTTLKGASVEEMETSVTKPIEQIINTVSGIDELKSTTKEGISQVVVQFLLEKNRDVAAQEVRDKVSTILGAAARRHRSADHRQGRPERHAGAADRRVRPAADAGDHGDHPQEDQGEPGNRGRRRLGDHRRRPAAGGQHLHRHRQADQLQPVDRGRAAGPGPPEPGTARRPRRPGLARTGAADHGPRGEARPASWT